MPSFFSAIGRQGPPVYSDINFMLLGIAIERLKACKLTDLELPPGLTWHPEPSETAATELCTWRGRVIRGEVHDENAFALGGAAGHAGLFGTIDGVLDVAQRLLEGVDPWLSELRTQQTATRCLGWEARHEGWSGVLPHPGVFPNGPGVASSECSRRWNALSSGAR